MTYEPPRYSFYKYHRSMLSLILFCMKTQLVTYQLKLTTGFAFFAESQEPSAKV